MYSTERETIPETEKVISHHEDKVKMKRRALQRRAMEVWCSVGAGVKIIFYFLRVKVTTT